MSSNGTMSLRRRLQLQVVLVAVLLCIIGGITLYFERASLYADRQAKVRNLVESAVTLIKGYEEMAAAGKLSEADAKQQGHGKQRDPARQGGAEALTQPAQEAADEGDQDQPRQNHDGLVSFGKVARFIVIPQPLPRHRAPARHPRR